MRVWALAQNKISSLSVANGFADSSNNKLNFYENKGQIKNLSDGSVNSDVKFYLQNKDLNVYLLGSGIAYQFNHFIYPEGYNPNIKSLKPDEMEKQIELQSQVKLETYRMDMQLKGANPNAHITIEGRSSDYINYYNHDVLDVHSYSKIIYHNVYPKIDWVVYSNKTGVKYDFVVHPGGDPSMIQLEFKDQEKIHLDELGNLIVENRLGKITEQKPVSFQNEQVIGTKFTLNDNVLSFGVGEYQQGKDLIIDPSIVWATYYGGAGDDASLSSSVDLSGNVYLCGYTGSTSGIANGGLQNSFAGSYDGFFVKFNSSGIRLWATYYGGFNYDFFTSSCVDLSGNIYLCGFTGSSSGIASGGFQNILGGAEDGFLVKFNTSGGRLWSTYYGGADDDRFNDISTDTFGNIYLCGSTRSTAGISSLGYQKNCGGGNDGFFVKLTSSGARVWASYYGGADNDYFLDISLGFNGCFYICGETNSTSGIASGGYQNSLGGFADGFLVKFDSSGSRLWATYYGGASSDISNSCVTDQDSNVYIAGYTSSSSNIAFNGYQNSIGGGSYDGFLAKFNSSGQRQWATYYGGSGQDASISSCVDLSGNIYMCGGYTNSSSGIAYGGFQNTFGGNCDGFLVKFNTSGTRLWSSYFGGTNGDDFRGITRDFHGNIYVYGVTGSTSGIAYGGYQNIFGGNYDGFVVKINPILQNQIESISGCEFCVKNNKTYTVSGNYLDTIKGYRNKDSLIIRYSVKILKSSFSSINKKVCNLYFWNNKYIYVSGTYFDTLKNRVGCDSFITLNLIIPEPNTFIKKTVCKQYFWNSTLIKKSGVYYDTLKNSLGCDSLLTLDLKVLAVSSATLSKTACTRFYWNGSYRNSSGVYYDTLLNAVGCDSIVTLNLTVYPEIRKTFNLSNCRYYEWNNKYLNITGIYIDTFSSYRGCDSIVTINLQIKNYAYIYDTLYKANCNPIVWRNKIISNTNVYYDTTLQKLDNCDLVHVLFFNRLNYNITQQPLNKFIYKDQLAEFSILSQNTSSKYNWQCNNNKGSNWFSLFDAGPYSGVSTNVLKVKDINAFLDAYAYRCIVSDSNCTEVSNAINLNICPEITQQPVDRYNGLNAHVYFDVKVDLENVNYQWQVNTGSGFVNLLNDNQYNGVKSKRLDVYIQDVAQRNNQFRCIVSASNCSDTSVEVKLHLLEKTYANPCNSQSLSSVYPNPTNDYINLLVPSDLVGKEYKIVDENGKELMVGVIAKEEIEISIKDYAAGIYFLRIGNEGLDCFRIIKLNE